MGLISCLLFHLIVPLKNNNKKKKSIFKSIGNVSPPPPDSHDLRWPFKFWFSFDLLFVDFFFLCFSVYKYKYIIKIFCSTHTSLSCTKYIYRAIHNSSTILIHPFLFDCCEKGLATHKFLFFTVIKFLWYNEHIKASDYFLLIKKS